jgi:hypothetical protein
MTVLNLLGLSPKVMQLHWLEETEKKQARQRTYKVTLRRVRATIVAVENNKYYVLLVCVCSLIFESAMRMRRIAICGLPRTTVFFHIIS